ncbi:MAG: hypothetical protein GF310_12930 [candidate division Zixibacteria bacterium]|nr:hypothetical protein [candidate division Zixibacteria bacterium]
MTPNGDMPIISLIVKSQDMKEMTKKLLYIFLIVTVLIMSVSIISCGSDQADAEDSARGSDDLSILVDWMSGYFTSKAQSESDSSYFDIHLHMIPIWKHRSDAHWLYVEQAMADYQHKPYRQRVYRVSQTGENEFESAVYTLEEPLRFAGVWNEENPLAGLTPDSLTLREGCSIILRREEDAFVGSTVEKDCASELRGAAYAISEVIIREDGMVSWDRGFDSEDYQVWGAVKGGYIFRKVKE